VAEPHRQNIIFVADINKHSLGASSMDKLQKYTWSAADSVTKEQVAFAIEFLLGRQPLDERELNIAAHIARRFPAPRLELFRNITSLPTFGTGNRDFHVILFDQMLRRRVFGAKRPPKVNLFCVGAARCGTTTLSAMVGQHDKIYTSPIKETNFFSHMSDGVSPNGVGTDIYEMFYFGWDGQPIVTDFSPNHLRYRHAVDGIYEYNPDARIIICLRNPIDRAISSFFYMAEHHRADNILDFFSEGMATFSVDLPQSEAWYSAKTILRQGLYHADVVYVKHRFNNVLIIEFSEFKELKRLYKRVCAFLEIDFEDDDRLSILDKPLNASLKDDNPSVHSAESILRDFYAADIRKTERECGIRLET